MVVWQEEEFWAKADEAADRIQLFRLWDRKCDWKFDQHGSVTCKPFDIKRDELQFSRPENSTSNSDHSFM